MGLRSLKFRVWDNELNKMFDVHLLDTSNEMASYHSYEKRYSSQGYDMPLEIMQFTGLKDKNGKEIYEGDLVKWADWEENKRNTPIEWDEGMCRYVCRLKTGQWRMFSSEFSVEVIGNIHSNPELLEIKVLRFTQEEIDQLPF